MIILHGIGAIFAGLAAWQILIAVHLDQPRERMGAAALVALAALFLSQ
jgi:hypothetical protein